MDSTNDTTITEEKPVTNIYLLLLAVFLSILNNNLSAFLNYVLSISHKFFSSSKYNDLRSELCDLEKQCAKIDMTDEFAKYARLQRKIIKLQEELKAEIRTHSGSIMKNKFYLRIVLGVLCVVPMYLYNSQPVVMMPEDWLYPVSGLLCWPGAQYGTVSFLVWCAISNSVVSTFAA